MTKLLLIIFGVLLPPILFESQLRIEHRIRSGVPLTENPSAKWDTELGWRGREHLIGNSKAPFSILVVGDSFTDGLTVSPSQMWFAQLPHRYPNTKVIAYGGLGYGNLQELLIMRKYLAQSKFDLIIVQLCSNDIQNNYLPLERASYMQRAPAPRPYLEDGKIEIRFARHNDWWLYPLISWSRFAYRYNNKWDRWLDSRAKRGEIDTVENQITRIGFDFAPFRKGLQTTTFILGEMSKLAGQHSMAFMLVDDLEPQSTAFKDIARSLKTPFLIVPRNIKLPSTARMADGTHFNEEGNALVGQALLAFLEGKKILPLARRNE